MLENLKDLRKELKHIRKALRDKSGEFEAIRMHYSYKKETKGISNDLAVIYENLELDDMIDCLDELIDYERDLADA
jgi:hypothetical protein